MNYEQKFTDYLTRLGLTRDQAISVMADVMARKTLNFQFDKLVGAYSEDVEDIAQGIVTMVALRWMVDRNNL